LASISDIAGPQIAIGADAPFGFDVEPPLCVDLDGTLVKSDTLLDGLCLFARRHPLEFWRVPLWVLRGRAHLKLEVGQRAPLNPARLPYNTGLLRFLHTERRAGRQIILTTGASGSLAQRVASHLGIFDGVLASDGTTNLTRGRKLARLKEEFGAFDYVGNSRADLPLLSQARVPMLANPTPGLRLAVRSRKIPVACSFVDRKPTLGRMIKAIRVHQWAKNVLLFLPLLMSHNLTPSAVGAAIAAFFCFSFAASASYLINDMLDIDNDRRHSSKRLRPFASGDLSVGRGMALVVALAAGSVAFLPVLSRSFDLWLALYIVSTMAYSFYLKQVAVVDVILLSSLYTLRLLAGGAATETEISPWLAGFSTFLFLSLAMVKRFNELENLRERGATRTHGRGYLVSDLEQIRSFGTSAATAAVVVFMLYIARSDVTALYRHSARLWLIVPLLIYWIYRVWLIASRGELDDDPVVFAMRDKVSLAVGGLVVTVALLAI
jgi:4-hydroxybenzoate polyprenyltransferase